MPHGLYSTPAMPVKLLPLTYLLSTFVLIIDLRSFIINIERKIEHNLFSDNFSWLNWVSWEYLKKNKIVSCIALQLLFTLQPILIKLNFSLYFLKLLKTTVYKRKPRLVILSS